MTLIAFSQYSILMKYSSRNPPNISNLIVSDSGSLPSISNKELVHRNKKMLHTIVCWMVEDAQETFIVFLSAL